MHGLPNETSPAFPQRSGPTSSRPPALGFALLVAIALFAAACYPKAGPPPGALSPSTVASASTRWPGVTAASLSHGGDLFMAKCNVCHAYPDLTVISDDRWPGIIEKMGNKADLSADEKDAVLHYVLASRSQQAGH